MVPTGYLIVLIKYALQFNLFTIIDLWLHVECIVSIVMLRSHIEL